MKRIGDFLRPTKAKIIVTLLIPLYIGYVVDMGQISLGSSSVGVLEQGWRFSPLPFLALLFGAIGVFLGEQGFFSTLSQFSFFESAWYFILEIVLPLLINYVIACTLVALYRRLFPRRSTPRPATPTPPPPSEPDMEL